MVGAEKALKPKWPYLVYLRQCRIVEGALANRSLSSKPDIAGVGNM